MASLIALTAVLSGALRALLAALPLLALGADARSQDAGMQPQSYRVALDNDTLRVVERRGVPQGTVFSSEAETPVVENISGSNIRTLIIEVKGD